MTGQDETARVGAAGAAGAGPAARDAAVAERAAPGTEPYRPEAFTHGYFDEFERTHPNIFASKLALLETAITLDGARRPGVTVSVGGGTGSYETALERDGIRVERIVEPAADLAAEAIRRGFSVSQALIQDVPFPDGSLDTVYYNGSAFGFIDERTLGVVFRDHRRQLRNGGVLALLDVPPASALGLAVQASFEIPDADSPVNRALRDSWYAAGTPRKEYWRRTERYRDLLRDAGFTTFRTWQTLRRHLVYQNDGPETVAEGYREGSYVALVAVKQA